MAPTLGIDELEKLFDFRTSPMGLQGGRSLLAALARESSFLNARVFPLLEQAERGRNW